ncbi:hypothetical protein BDA96_03G031500 [Sorghum bicolor]|uniref:DUF1677 family protein n=2 Tax=Sorghum bicolor TaxID=4558 RepID=A0A921RBQ8_SORBI|nr:uncharacterized protein LOC8084330 [Sorghum bicolor]KAG0536055.1 hypothetical protein BDA96_03G031500 [Sorghum bicolor]KXG31608.1 hypothetical protein SORBI_3003G028800 [Sorghum bicolor]|eukprot:XP_021313096.1 uncharacterized protein LOC8084330 [Sorghum bicolor]
MAPNGDAAVVAAAQAAAPAPKKQAARRQSSKPRRISMEGLQRAMSDLALELSRDSSKKQAADAAAKQQQQVPQLPAIAEQQHQQQGEEELARCECCGMQEECTPEYVRRVRDRYCGRWVCGLCAAAVNAEAERAAGGGGSRTVEDALAAHMAVCGRFNRVGRANPVLMQTEAMREILRKRCRSNSPRDHGGPAGALARSSSCIPAITKDLN